MEPTHTPSQLFSGTGDFWLSERDRRILTVLLDRNFLAVRHLIAEGLFADRRRASERMTRLHAEGLVARGRVASWRRDRVVGWEYAFCLTQHGFRCLGQGGDPGAHAVQRRWKPPYEGGSRRINASHELAVADLCYALTRHLGGPGREVAWRGSRSLVRGVGPNALHDLPDRRYVSPDAAVTILHPGGMDVLLVEYEQSVRPHGLVQKLSGYVSYFEQGAWKKSLPLSHEPRVLVSMSGTADRARYYANPFASGVEVADQMTHKMWAVKDRLLFIDEESWRRQLFLATMLDRHQKVDLFDAAVTGNAL